MTPLPRPSRRLLLALGLAAAVPLAITSTAAAAPPPGIADVVTAAQPVTIAWSASPPTADGNAVRYEGGIGDELTDFGAALSTTRSLEEGPYTFRVRSVETDSVSGFVVFVSDFATATVVVDRTAPTIRGSAPAGWRRSATVTFSCDGTGSAIRSCGPAVTVTTEGADQSVSGTAVDAAGNTASAAVGDIDIDRTPPTSVTFTAPADMTADRRPTIAWNAATDALSGVKGYQIYIDRTTRNREAPYTTATSYRVPANLAPGPHTVFVRSVDLADNGTDSPIRRFVVGDPPPASPPGSEGTPGSASGSPGSPGAAPAPEETTTGGGRTVLRPPTERAGLLSPRAGLRLRTPRPALRWRSLPRGTTLSNVQIFRMRGRSLTKVHSAFPRGATYRVPAGVLRPGETYVWRVWPFRGRRGFTPAPPGISWFRLGPLADLLPAAARARIVAPTTPRAARGEPLTVSWRPRPGVSRYKVTLERFGQERVFSALAVSTSVTIPGPALRRAGSYALVVRSARRGSLRRFTPAPWAAAALRVR